MITTLILIHGAFQGGWAWEKIQPVLQKAGYEVFCPTLTGLGQRYKESNPHIGLEDHIQDICALIDTNYLSDVTLIGHSYGGIVMAGVAKQRSTKIKRLIYLDAPIAEDGKSLLDLLGEEAAAVFRTSALEHGEGWQVDVFPPSAFGLIKETDIAWAVPQHTPQALKTFEDPVSVLDEKEASHLIQSYIQCLPGNNFTDLQVKKAQAKGWKIYQLESGHSPMITHPTLLLDLLCHQILLEE